MIPTVKDTAEKVAYVNIKFGLATPTNLWRMDLDEKQTLLEDISAAGFDHLFMADHVSFRNGSGTDGLK